MSCFGTLADVIAACLDETLSHIATGQEARRFFRRAAAFNQEGLEP
jgi:hypothetical protein